jgi:hypothetical protein
MKTLATILLLILVFGCVETDEGGLHTTIHLSVIDEFTGESLPNEKFYLQECDDSWVLSVGCYSSNEIYSDSLGKAVYEFINEASTYYLLKYKPVDFHLNEYSHLSPIYFPIDEGETNNIEFNLRPIAQLGIHFKHNGLSEYTRQSYFLSRETENDKGTSDYIVIEGVGFYDLSRTIDTIIYKSVMQEETYTINTFLYKTTSGYDEIKKTIDISRADTLIVEFEF